MSAGSQVRQSWTFSRLRMWDGGCGMESAEEHAVSEASELEPGEREGED